MNISCLIVDDEQIARQGLQKYVDQISFLDLKGMCKNASEANDYLVAEPVDLLFLDIEMPQLSGLDFLRTLPSAPNVIFTTAYSEFALEGFEFNVVDYLVKPISFERFLSAANKAHRFINPKNKAIEAKDYIFLKNENQLIKVPYSERLYIKSMQNYTVFYTVGGKEMALLPMKQVISELPAGQFVQTHKSYVVSLEKVKSIEGNQLWVGEEAVPISTRMRKEVVKLITGDRVLKK